MWRNKFCNDIPGQTFQNFLICSRNNHFSNFFRIPALKALSKNFFKICKNIFHFLELFFPLIRKKPNTETG